MWKAWDQILIKNGPFQCNNREIVKSMTGINCKPSLFLVKNKDPLCPDFSTLCFGDGIGKWLTKEVTWALGHVCPSFFKDCPAITFRWKNPSKGLLAKSWYISHVMNYFYQTYFALVLGRLGILEFMCGRLIFSPTHHVVSHSQSDGVIQVSKSVIVETAAITCNTSRH